MAPSLRGKFSCFYCGCRSAQTRRSGIRNWQCKNCEAVNYLDENGEITDPPATENLPDIRYAQPNQRPSSPVFDSPDDSLFCKTCLKNQHIFSESLASYFPPLETPNYRDYEKQYPQFRKDLDERYPQVCEDCEPRVRQRIQVTGYAAKTDHLRRMMERTRGGSTLRGGSGLKGFLVFIGGTAWFMSVAGQVAWDVLALTSPEQEHDGLIDEAESSLGSDCLHQIMRGSALPSGCTSLLNPVGRVALFLGLLSFWWNPRLQERFSRTGGRMVGRKEYYKLQAILLVARFLAWSCIAKMPSTDENRQMIMGIHSALLFFGALLTVMSFRAISIDYTPQVIFQDGPGSLSPQESQLTAAKISSEAFNSSTPRAMPYTAQVRPGNGKFMINDLAPKVESQFPITTQPPYQPPTPPPEENDDEAMDWTPSQQATLRPATSYRATNSAMQLTQQTPFRGHLPADVVSMEHRLRNPPNKPTFRKASDTQKQNFFRTPKRITYRDTDTNSDAGTEYEPSLAEITSPAEARFADPKFRFQPDQPADTGLERLLANGFSLHDGPPEIRAIQQGQAFESAQTEAQPTIAVTVIRWHRIPIFILLITLLCYHAGTLKPPLAVHEMPLRQGSLLISALASIRSLVLVFFTATAVWSGSDLVIYALELITSIILLLLPGESARGSSLTVNHASLDAFCSILVAVIAVQELWMITLSFRTSNASNQTLATPAPDPNPSPEPQAVRHHPITRKRVEPQPPSLDLVRTTHPRDDVTQRTTRSRTNDNNAFVGNGFGSLSLGENGRTGHIADFGSLSLGQPRRKDRNGVW